MKNKMYLVLPCYNEEEILASSIKKLNKKMDELIKNKKIDKNSKMVFIDDGSKDNTWNIIKNASNKNNRIIGLKFSGNRGHQAAVLAGLKYSTNKCDFTISIDSDLQQDINAIDDFIEKYNDGNQIVYGVRNSRNTDGFFKKISSQMFYKLMTIFGCNIIPNHADYRLVSNKVLIELNKYEEQSIFLRGLFPSMGYKNDIVYFDVFEREAGKSKYTLKKMLRLAKDGITAFSVKPLQIITYFGVLIFILSSLFLLQYIFFQNNIILYFGIAFLPCSFILISLGIIASYIGQIYEESKKRPKYLIEEVIDNEIVR